MFADVVLVRGDVNAVDLIVGNVAVQPLDLWPEFLEYAQRLERDLVEFDIGKGAGAGDFAFDDELRHGTSLHQGVGQGATATRRTVG